MTDGELITELKTRKLASYGKRTEKVKRLLKFYGIWSSKGIDNKKITSNQNGAQPSTASLGKGSVVKEIEKLRK